MSPATLQGEGLKLNTTCGTRAHTRRQRTQAPAQTTIHTSIRALRVSVTALMENMIELVHSSRLASVLGLASQPAIGTLAILQQAASPVNPSQRRPSQ